MIGTIRNLEKFFDNINVQYKKIRDKLKILSQSKDTIANQKTRSTQRKIESNYQ
ncbi:Uncharacterised protein [Campylobacter lari]|nr:Uncharacterised protein [Campylobacter lari]